MTPRPRKLHLLRMLPDGLLSTRGPVAPKRLYLTFDDGPHPAHTAPLLDLLAEHGVKATFFLVGAYVEGNDALVQRMVDEGHALGNHSFSHPRFRALARTSQMDEVARTDSILERFDGQPRHSFRPPYGSLSLSMVANFLRSRRQITYWSYDSLDYTGRPADELVAILERSPPTSGDIILMHDDATISREILQVMLPAWKRQGYSFDRLPVRRGEGLDS